MAGSVWRKLIDAQKHCRCQPSHCQTVDAVLFFDCSFFDFPSMLFSIVRLFDCAWRCSAEWGYYEAEKDMSWWCSSSIWAVCKLHMRIAHVKSNKWVGGWGTTKHNLFFLNMYLVKDNWFSRSGPLPLLIFYFLRSRFWIAPQQRWFWVDLPNLALRVLIVIIWLGIFCGNNWSTLLCPYPYQKQGFEPFWGGRGGFN